MQEHPRDDKAWGGGLHFPSMVPIEPKALTRQCSATDPHPSCTGVSAEGGEVSDKRLECESYLR